MTMKRGNELKIGDVIDCWGGGPWEITKLVPYTGPYEFICALAYGTTTRVARIGMSIESHAYYEVLNK